jgi:DNA-binding HxlR family transcriptional regulator
MSASPQFDLVHDLLDLAGAKWTINVIAALRDERMRFNEIAHAVEGISQKQLTSTLRSLQRHGFAFRVAFATIPPRVEYELTELGHDFARSVGPLGAFAMQNQRSIEAARRDFDAA